MWSENAEVFGIGYFTDPGGAEPERFVTSTCLPFLFSQSPGIRHICCRLNHTARMRKPPICGYKRMNHDKV